MNFLFSLVLMSSLVFGLVSQNKELFSNPIAFVLIGWLPVVSAYYLSRFMDYSRLFILNRNYEAYIVSKNGSFWNGEEWAVAGTPKIFYNNFQVEESLKFLHAKYGIDSDELYVRVILPQSFFERVAQAKEEDEGCDIDDDLE